MSVSYKTERADTCTICFQRMPAGTWARTDYEVRAAAHESCVNRRAVQSHAEDDPQDRAASVAERRRRTQEVHCPSCHAVPGTPCVALGKPRERNHKSRWQAREGWRDGRLTARGRLSRASVAWAR